MIQNAGIAQKHLIEDIAMPKWHPAVDVRQPAVRHQAIGALDELYKQAGSGGGRAFAYTRVPPLSTLNLFDEQSRYGIGGWRQAREIVAGLWGAVFGFLMSFPAGLKSEVVELAGRIHDAAIAVLDGTTFLPRKYTRAHGLQIDWHTPTFDLVKWVGMPLIVLAGVAALLAQPYGLHGFRLTSPPHGSSQTAGTGQTDTGSQNSSTSGGSSARGVSTGSQKHGSSGNVQSSAGAVTGTGTGPGSQGAGRGAGTATGAISGTSPTTGTGITAGTPGVSSGSSTVPQSVPGTSAAGGWVPPTTVPLPITITVPPANSQVDGKRIVGSSGTTLILN